MPKCLFIMWREASILKFGIRSLMTELKAILSIGVLFENIKLVFI